MVLLDFAAANICVYFQYLFMHCVCADIFWRKCFDLRFKIVIVVIVRSLSVSFFIEKGPRKQLRMKRKRE